MRGDPGRAAKVATSNRSKNRSGNSQRANTTAFEPRQTAKRVRGRRTVAARVMVRATTGEVTIDPDGVYLLSKG